MTPSKTILIVGTNTLQNRLITAELEQKTGFFCAAVQRLEQVGTLDVNINPRACLVLYDCLAKNGKACLTDVEKDGAGREFMLGLFNLERNWGLEKEAFACGVRGFFYQAEPFALLVKGAVGILNGEYWIPRPLLAKWVNQKTMAPKLAPEPGLTVLENRVLRLLADGASNPEMARALCISPHTVKKHLQKIFKKINVHTKTEAMLWVSRHLDS